MKLNRLLKPLTRRNKRQMLTSASRAIPLSRSGLHLEPLENRQLMSLTLSIETTSGAKTATVTSVGQSLNLEIVATVTGSEAGSNDGIDSACGSILSTVTDGSYSVGGNLENATPTGPNGEFQANGAEEATSQDLNGDGYLDAGSNNNADIAGFFNARAGGIVTDGAISGDSNSFVIGNLNYVVTNLNYGQPTDITFRLRNGLSAGAYDAIWQQDGQPFNDSTQTVQIGSPLVVTDPNLTAPPGGSIAGVVTSTSAGVSKGGLSGVTMFLNTTGSSSYASGDVTTDTDSSGDYDFEGLRAGTYYVGEETPSGYTVSSPSTTTIKVTLSTSQNVSAQDFIDAGTGSIAGTVTKVVSGVTSNDSGVTMYLDLNDTGSLASGDPTAITSSAGGYSFTGLAPATYLLRQSVPSGFKQTSPANTPTLLTISGGNTITGQNFTDTATTVAATGSIAGTVDKVVSGTTTGESGVIVFLDTNDNGTLDSGEPSSTTSSTGTFSFTGLAAGSYYLREEVPTGYTQTSPSSSPTKITLTSGQNAAGDNFTNTASTVAPTTSIAGTVSKVVSGTTSADSGVTVYLDLNDTGALTSGDPSTTTSSTGTYSFTKLAAGTYFLREVVPTGYVQTSPSSSPTTITLTAGKAVTGENFTDTASTVSSAGSISGEVYSDVNNSGKLASGDAGIPGVTVYLDLKKDGKDDTGDPSTTTSSTGAYTFTGLAAGTYLVREQLLSGDSFTSPSAGDISVSVASGAKVTGENFGNTGALSLPGLVFNDINGNGKEDGSDAGIGGFVVYCDLNNTGVFVASDNNKTTASNGTFDFVSLKAGTYIIRVVAKSGYTLESPTSGYYTVVLQPGLPVTGITFAEHPTNANNSSGVGTAITLSGTVFNDLAGTGVQTANDPGLAGWVVYCDLKDTGTFVASDNNKTTLSNGTFEFVSLAAGTYTIRVVPQAGYAETLPDDGFYTVTLAAGDPVSIAFGEKAS